MGDTLIMSQKELRRKTILDAVIRGQLKIEKAAKKLSVCKKTIRRSLKRYKEYGDKGLIHKSRGKPSNRAADANYKQTVIQTYSEKYMDFGPTFASEKLEEDDGLKVHPETLRLWLKKEGLWSRHRKKKSHRSRRERRAHFGDMLQIDGSIHKWFDGVEKKQCLMNMVDDATGKTLSLMDDGETTRAAFSLLKWWITDVGIPVSVYVDLKSLYVSPKSLKDKTSEDESLVEAEWLTHFSAACKKLGIEVIKAYSPQAKGRVERNHAVYQDRFVKELKLKNIKTVEGANELLSNGFINKLNEKFAKPAANEQDAHVPLSSHDDLDQILCWEYVRQIKNDWTIQFDNKFYQITRKGLNVQPKQKITVKRHLDDSISLWYKNQPLAFQEIAQRTAKEPKKASSFSPAEQSEIARQNKHKTPWSRFNPAWIKSGKKAPRRTFSK